MPLKSQVADAACLLNSPRLCFRQPLGRNSGLRSLRGLNRICEFAARLKPCPPGFDACEEFSAACSSGQEDDAAGD
jgi:hypothetical protein